MCDLTTADGFELVSAEHKDRGDVTDSVSIDRWTNYGKDRLYLNGLRTGDGWISLKSDEAGGDKWTKVDARRELEGDELTIEVYKGPTVYYTLVVRVHGDGFEAADDTTNESEPEIACDGGTETTITNTDIESAIKQHDDPDHPESLTVDEVRRLLDAIQQTIWHEWGPWMDAIENGHTQVVEDTGDTLVLAVRDAPYAQILDQADESLPVAVDDIARRVVSTAVHNAAERLTDRRWGHDYPVVIAKPASAAAGETYLVALINGLQRRGCTPGQAWAYYGVEIRGASMNQWGKRKGDHDHKNVSDALQKAKEKLP